MSSTDMAATTVLEVSVLKTRAKQAHVASLARMSMKRVVFWRIPCYW